MKQISVILLGLLFCTGLNAQQVNDPNVEKREAKDFHGINVSNAFDVYMTQGNEEAVAISASEDKFKERIKVEVKDGILYVHYENGLKWNSGRMKLKVYISFKNIDKLNVSGACDVFLMSDFKADELKIHFSGASDLKGEGKLDVKKLFVDLSGASDIKVRGTSSQLNVEASGASDFRGFDFTTDYCDVRASGASSIQITVNKELSAQASGASDVHYKGDGMIRDIKTSGASNISRKS